MSQGLASEKETVENAIGTDPAGRRDGRPRTRMVIALVLLLAFAAGGYAAYLHFRDRVSSDDANVDGHITAIASKISGNVLEVLVRDNQTVKAGEVLVRIDPRDAQVAVDLAKAALAQAESQLNSARAAVPWVSETTESGQTVASAQLADAQTEVERARIAYEQANTSDLAFAQANVSARQAQNERAQADLSRMKPLMEKAEISRQQYDAYVAAAAVSQSELRAAQERLSSAQKDAAIRKAALDSAISRVNTARAQLQSTEANRKQVSIRTADTGSAAAAVEAARARLQAAALNLSYTSIAAPIDGTVTRKSVEVGQVVQPGQSLMTVIPLHQTWITANFKETQLADVRPGQRARVHVDMYGKTIRAHVDSIASATGSRLSLLPPENATGNFVKVVQRIPVKLLIDSSEGLTLRPGMNVTVIIFTK